MKAFKSTVLVVLISLFFLVGSGFSQQPAQYLTVDTYVGKVEYRIGKAGWKTAQVGDQIPANADLRIRALNDSADLIFPDGSIVKIQGGSGVKKVSALILENEKSKTSKNNKVAASDVETQTGVASVRGNLSQASAFLTVGMFIGSCEYKLGEGEWIAIKTGDRIPENAEVRVNGKNDSLELTYPDGSTLAIFGLSSVKVVDILKDKDGKKVNFLTLLAGKIFAKVAKTAEQEFKVETATAVASVRGTRFGVSFIPGQGGLVVVSEGLVAVGDLLGQFQPVLIQKGFMSLLSAVSGMAPSAPQAAPLQTIQLYDPEYKPETGDSGQSSSSPSPQIQPSPSPSPQTTQPSIGSDECSEQGFNWSVAAENIDGKVWNKVLLSPTFKFGVFSFALYIPVYFQNLDDIFVPNRWYNYNEWDFLSWQDAIEDVLLKIRFVQVQTDTFLFKLGNLPEMTIGHGSLVDGYANDLEFPSKRRVGIQLNLDFGQFGFESMVGDVFLTKLFAGRIFTRPLFGAPVIGNLGVGVSAFIDQDPLLNGNSKAFGYSADLDLPILKFPLFAMTLYSDAATLGYADDILKTNQMMKGLGLFAGLKGTIVIIDYRAEYRRIQGGFIPNYVDKFYDVDRKWKYASLAYGTAPNFNGFLLSAGKTFEGFGGLLLSYQHYLPEDGSTNINNFLHLEAKISKCLFKKAYGLIAYDRQNFGFGDLFGNFLGNGAIITTQVFYEVASGAYIGLTTKKYYQADAAGNIQEKYTVALTTDFGF